MAHTLEMGDVHKKGKIHAGAVVIPATLVLGGNLCSNGKSIILAVVLGYEVAIRIAMAVGAKAHRMKGWHATGTCGTFGASAACSKLLMLKEESNYGRYDLSEVRRALVVSEGYGMGSSGQEDIQDPS